MPGGGIRSASVGGGGGGGGGGHLESPPLARKSPSTAFRYLQLTNQIARITSAIV